MPLEIEITVRGLRGEGKTQIRNSLRERAEELGFYTIHESSHVKSSSLGEEVVYLLKDRRKRKA